MKLIYISDNYYFKSRDNSYWSSTCFPLEFLLKNLPEISEWIFWGRILETENTESLYQLPVKVGNCVVSYKGPVVKRKHFACWVFWITKSFLALRKEISNSDIVFFKMPFFFSCIGHYMVRKHNIVLSHQVGDPQGTIPVMFPRLKYVGKFMGYYCKKVAAKADQAFFVSNVLQARYGVGCINSLVSNESRIEQNMIRENVSFDIHNPPKMVYVGRLSPEKGLEVLFRAFSKLVSKTPAQLWIIGDGPSRSELVQLAEQIGIADSINWFGPIRWGPELFSALGKADTLVLPSFSEGLPLVLIEAMSQGLVVIGSSIGGIPELLKYGRAGLLFPAGNVDSLAKAMDKSINDIPLRTELVKKALECAKENSLETQAGLVIREIKRLISKKINAGPLQNTIYTDK